MHIDNILDMNNHDIETFILNDSKIYFINNFYKNPRKLKRWILSQKSEYHKKGEKGYNGIYFEDKRHIIQHSGMKKVTNYVSQLCKQIPQEEDKIITNYLKFKNHKFNDYENNYWHPHRDTAYTAIIYFDKSNTNLYECLDIQEEELVNLIPEHQKPWKEKNKWKKIATLHGSFNKLILFDGNKFFHGADISSKEFTHKFRMNQVIFFK